MNLRKEVANLSQWASLAIASAIEPAQVVSETEPLAPTDLILYTT
jgi:hypothetical protein